MALFFGIEPGQELKFEGLRVSVTPDGEWAWLHGKWFELGEDHAVVVVAPGEKCKFVKPDGTIKPMGSFPSWLVMGKGKAPAKVFKPNISQFRGGHIQLGNAKHQVPLQEL
jgi:hypothetical protein